VVPSLYSGQFIGYFVAGSGREMADIVLIFGRDWRMKVAESSSSSPLVDMYS